MYRLQLSSRALKNYKRIDRKYQKILAKAINELRQNPNLGKPLKWNLMGHFKLRVGTYRVIYKIFKDLLVVLVLNIEHRKDVYR